MGRGVLLLDIFRNPICLLKWSFLASLAQNFSTMCFYMLSKFFAKSAQKSFIFLNKANFERCLFLLIAFSVDVWAEEHTILSYYSFYQRYLSDYLLPAQKKVKISNWYDPTIEDYKALQHYLKNAKRPELDLLCVSNIDERRARMRDFNLITEDQLPQFKTLYFNRDPSNKEKCVVTYISFNRNYKKGLEQLCERLEAEKFDGHFIYRIGGWPGCKEGCLELFDVPYSFKLCALLEAKNMGYKECLWLDASVKPLKSLEPIFDLIKQNGLCFFAWKNPHIHRNTCSSYVIHRLGLTLEEFNELQAIAANVLGFDFSKEEARNLLEMWYQIAKKRIGFLSFCPEEVALSSLLYKNKLYSTLGNPLFFQCDKKCITEDTILFVDWNRVHNPKNGS